MFFRKDTTEVRVLKIRVDVVVIGDIVAVDMYYCFYIELMQLHISPTVHVKANYLPNVTSDFIILLLFFYCRRIFFNEEIELK